MKIDATISANLSTVARAARHYEALGYDGLRVAELNHDPFLALTLLADAGVFFATAFLPLPFFERTVGVLDRFGAARTLPPVFLLLFFLLIAMTPPVSVSGYLDYAVAL